MILIDTSAWVAFFRGIEPLAEAVDTALGSGEAALCEPVVTELRRGLRPPQRRQVLSLLDGCPLLSQPQDLWESAGDLGAALARRGLNLETLDLLIAVHAIAHATPVLSGNSDFRAMERADIGLVLAR